MASTTKRGAKARPSKPEESLPLLRTSERSAFKTCEFKWSLTYGRQLEPITAAPALRFGSLVHAALAAYYKKGLKRGPKPATTFLRLYNEELKEQSKMGFRDEDGTWHEAGELGVAMMENYLEEYGSDDRWEVIATEKPFQVVVNYPNGSPWFEYTGILDGIWSYLPTKKLWVVDHKTTSGIGGTAEHPAIPPHLMMDDQAGAYWSFGVEYMWQKKLLDRDQKLQGMLFNFIRKAKPDERQYKLQKGKRIYLNLDGAVSKKQPAPLFARFPILRDEYERELQRAHAMADYRRIEMVRSGELTPLKTPSQQTCSWCPVRDVCELHETGSDWESMLNQTMRPWDAYSAHEIREGR